MKKIILIAFLVSISFQSCKVVQHYKVNEEFKIELEKEGDGGYQWGFMEMSGIKELKTSKKKIAAEEGKLLVSYHKIFSLKGVKPGRYNLEFHFLRSFEKLDTIPAENKKLIKVKIKK
jgi:predicted secreted protein